MYFLFWFFASTIPIYRAGYGYVYDSDSRFLRENYFGGNFSSKLFAKALLFSDCQLKIMHFFLNLRQQSKGDVVRTVKDFRQIFLPKYWNPSLPLPFLSLSLLSLCVACRLCRDFANVTYVPRKGRGWSQGKRQQKTK
jgi:hypothetical protein